MSQPPKPKPIKQHWYVTFIYGRRIANATGGVMDFGSCVLGFDTDYFPISLASKTVAKMINAKSVSLVAWKGISKQQVAEASGESKPNAIA